MSQRQFRLRLSRWNRQHKRRKIWLLVRAIGTDNLWTDCCERQRVKLDKDIMFMLNEEDKRVRVELRSNDGVLAMWETAADSLINAGTSSCTSEVLRREKDLSPVVALDISPTSLSSRERIMYLDLDVDIPYNNRFNSLTAVLYRSDGEIAYRSEQRGLHKPEYTNRPPFGTTVDASTKAPAPTTNQMGAPVRTRTIRFNRAMITCYKDTDVNSFALKLFASSKKEQVEIGCAILVGDVSKWYISEEFPLCYGKYNCGTVLVQQRERSATPKYVMLKARLLVKPLLQLDLKEKELHMKKPTAHFHIV
eukprot:Plantae.Rhodophyta-Purpureofilum_apyrenoidigerum.ctg10073.p1 GENE.Plantae.Rhodophyta-Purpureofilum_apyrenoidigerum.ctg10073~~Plantae.Rhodophyta-Purpureofilum_apyrenoidigerum.ctg10073.p1  ORF type:complete len:307 (+),score=49.79 Plantae.Rhodophyta-Purpureofilum_apyrenoidigerum.ctg10073:282-1202(+)